MENCWLNDEEKAIMNDLKGLPYPEIVGTLEDSMVTEPDPSGRRVLRALLSKLKEGLKPDSG